VKATYVRAAHPGQRQKDRGVSIERQDALSQKREMPATMDCENVENCTGDRDIYCPYADVFGCDGKREHDVEKAEREQKEKRGPL
jgi:hypothetical protein